MKAEFNRMFLKYWVTGVWIFFFSFVSLGSCVLAASAGCVWEILDTQSKVTVVLGVFVNWGTAMMAFLSRMAKQVNVTLPEERSTT